jgi:hypothetical protein
VYLMLRTWSVMKRSPFLVCMSRPHGDPLLMLRPPHLQTVMMKFTWCTFHPVLIWFRVMMMMMRFLFRALSMLSCPSSTSCPIVRPRPASQASGGGQCPLGYGEYRFASSSSSSPLLCTCQLKSFGHALTKLHPHQRILAELALLWTVDIPAQPPPRPSLHALGGHPCAQE